MQKKLPIITCPVCNQQYLLSEIYMPNSFFGKQKEIHKQPDGSIDFIIGDEPDLEEEFVCEQCGSKLSIHADINFEIEVNSEEDFDKEYESVVNKPAKIKLEEEDLF